MKRPHVYQLPRFSSPEFVMLFSNAALYQRGLSWAAAHAAARLNASGQQAKLLVARGIRVVEGKTAEVVVVGGGSTWGAGWRANSRGRGVLVHREQRCTVEGATEAAGRVLQREAIMRAHRRETSAKQPGG